MRRTRLSLICFAARAVLFFLSGVDAIVALLPTLCARRDRRQAGIAGGDPAR